MSTRTVTYIVTAIPIPDFTSSTTYPLSDPLLHLSNATLSNSLTTTRPHPLHGGAGDNPAPGFQWPAAPHSTILPIGQTSYASSRTTFPAWPPAQITPPPAQTETATVIVTIAPTPPASLRTTSDFVVPTQYLSQVPRGWPYTQFGVGRRGQTASWGLTDAQGMTVAEVRHRVYWWPRPVWTGSGESGFLAGWRSTFAVPRAATPTAGTVLNETLGVVVLSSEKGS